ncbi:MAG: DUF721 domain-containing protein [Desulfatitalea sp.]|nr:DUF721 domain-containing protein [Desulfatitalea sp.]
MQKRRNNKQFTHIGQVVEKVLREYRPQGDSELIRVWEVWESTVGKAIATNAQPKAFKGDVLLVQVASSTWLHHIRFLEKEMVTKINAALGGNSVRAFKFKVGAL